MLCYCNLSKKYEISIDWLNWDPTPQGTDLTWDLKQQNTGFDLAKPKSSKDVQNKHK